MLVHWTQDQAVSVDLSTATLSLLGKTFHSDITVPLSSILRDPWAASQAKSYSIFREKFTIQNITSSQLAASWSPRMNAGEKAKMDLL